HGVAPRLQSSLPARGRPADLTRENTMQLEVQHDPHGSRFHVPPEELHAGPSKIADMGMVLSYTSMSPGVLDFKSTLVPPHLRGQGLGSELVRQALDWARREGYQVIPSCPFVAAF